MGSIRRAPRTGRWEARYRDPAGRQRTKTFPTKSDAKAHLSAVETDVMRGLYVDPAGGRVTFEEWASHVESTRVNRRATTRARDARLMRTRVLPTFGEVHLGAVDRVDVRSWVAGLEAAGLAPSTVRKCYQLAAHVFEEAVESGLIPVSPCRRVPLPTDERVEPVLLTPAHVDAIADAIAPRYRALVLAAAYSGLRWGELAGLRVARVDFLRRRIDVAEVLVEVDGAEVGFGPPKTGKSRGLVGFPAFLADVLSAHIATYPDPDRGRGLVFTSDDGTPLRRGNFRQRVWRPAVREAGAPDRARFHDLRHATASWLIDAGANPLEVAERLRHTRVTTTLATYGHLFPGTDERLDELLETAFQNVPRASVGTRNAISRGADVVQALPERR